MIDNTYEANTMSLWWDKIGKRGFARHKCDVRAYVRCRRAWRGLERSCPQMTCGWHGLCQTGRQVALGSHSRTWVFEPCCTNSHVHTNAWTCAPKAGVSHKYDALGGPGSPCASSWKWHVSLRRGMKRLSKGEDYFSFTLSVPNRSTMTELLLA